MCFNQDGDISLLNGNPLKLVEQFIYIGSIILSTENDVNMRIAIKLTTDDKLTAL